MEKNKMPCGSNHSCFDCTAYYLSQCSWLTQMTDEEYENHEIKLFEADPNNNQKAQGE